MKEYLPKHLQLHCCNEQLHLEADGGFEIKFQFVDESNTAFKVYKSIDSISPTYIEYLKTMTDLAKKYDKIRKQGYLFGSMRTNQGATVWGYNKGSEFVVLEDITGITQKMMDDKDCGILVKVLSHQGQSFEIFNSLQNGYNAMISHTPNADKKIKLRKSSCRKCSNDTFELLVSIHNVGKNDLLIEQPCIEINDENWTNAFDWITIDLKCSQCGHVIKKWFEMETM